MTNLQYWQNYWFNYTITFTKSSWFSATRA